MLGRTPVGVALTKWVEGSAKCRRVAGTTTRQAALKARDRCDTIVSIGVTKLEATR
jgi:hypothetical protein